MNFTIVNTPDAYGTLIVLDKSGAFVRNFNITAQQMKACRASIQGYLDAGVTAQELGGGTVVIEGKVLDVGQAWQNADGSITCMTGSTTDPKDKIVDTITTIPSGKYAANGAAVIVPDSLLPVSVGAAQ